MPKDAYSDFSKRGAKAKLPKGYRKNSCLWKKNTFHDSNRADVYNLRKICLLLRIVGNKNDDC